MHHLQSLRALILAGGQSSRMGTDKYLLEVNGRPQYQHLHALLTGTGLETCISCHADQQFPKGFSLIKDQFGPVGPIGGLASAHVRYPDTDWLVVACDLVALDAATLCELVAAYDFEADVTCFRLPGSPFYETTLAIYRPSALQRALECIHSGQFGLQTVLKGCRVKSVEPSCPQALKNVNTPKDME